MHSRWKLLTALAATAVLVHAPAPALADADACATDAAPAKCYLAAAQSLKESKPGEAAKLYLKSYRLDPKIDPLAGYGFALALDKQYVAAAEVLEKAVEEYDKVRIQLEHSNADANTLFQVIHRLEFVKEEITKLVPQIGKVQLKVVDKQLPAGVTVSRKDGSDLHGSDATTLLVNPNSDILVFRYPSGKTLDFEVNVPAGTISSVDVPPEPQAPPPPPPAPKPPVDESIGLRRFSYISGGVGAAVLLGGLTYVVVADVPSAGLAAGIMVVGAAGIGASVYLWFRAEKKHKAWQQARTTAFVPVVTDHMVGAMFTGTL